MLPVKLVRSLVLGETINMNNKNNKNNTFHLHDNNNAHDHDADDEYEDDDDDPHHHHHHHKLKNKKIPVLLFTPTRELISDTFRLANIARDIGMDFHPTPSLSHLIFSWPSSSSPSLTSLPSSSSSTLSTLSTPFTPSSTSNHRPSFSSTITTSSSTSANALQNDGVPLPFPSLSTPTASLSLLRFFVSLSKGLFKLVFFNWDPQTPEFERNWFYNCPPLSLFSRVSARKVGSMDDLSRDLAGHGWALFRTHKRLPGDSVYLFQKKDSNRVRARVRARGGGGGVGECRIRELRLPALDFKSEVPLRILLYILLMTDDIFYLA